ncbi:restriction endonuclease subunit S [Bradyrhizobium sp. NAS96.2]|uniref:restriction endonuclease subunit S n=1 Tax=Bradyrhizobium sp. NAS96.2 TaxID=1680160 RepID=UPI00093AE5B5|nr:restriction endonuclease subunit S [Bradyrhizobium sp. NAS96.2]
MLPWRTVAFKEIVSHSAFGPRFSGDLYSESGNVATLRQTDIGEHGEISYSSMPLAIIDEDRFCNHFLLPGDLVISRSGAGVGTTAVFKNYHRPVLPGAFLIRFRFNANACPDFYRYYFNSSVGRPVILSVARGAAQPNINISNVELINVPLPPRRVQDSIVEILSAYDDLIENNRRRIALLEQAVRMLYREWFVRFRFPGHEHVKIIDGIPEGWERRTFDSVCEAVGGGTPSTAKPEFWDDGDIPWYTPTDITRNSCLALLDSNTKITEAGLRGSSAKMLPSGTVLMTSRASVGFFGIIDGPSCTNQGFISILPKDPRSRMYLLYNLMDRVEEIRSHAGGATYKEISKGKFKALPVVIPDMSLSREFDQHASDLHEQVRTLHTMNKKLAQARDLLLPRLMNGKIVV